MIKPAPKQAFIFLGLLILLLGLSPAIVLASGEKTYYPAGGSDVTGDSPTSLSSTDATRLQSVDESLITTSDWPDNAYSESEYVEFTFAGDYELAADAVITSFKVTIVYRTSATTLAAAKLKVYEEENSIWHEEAIGVPTAANVDTTFTTGNLSSYIDTADDLNNLVVRFYAYDQSTTSTSINQVRADFDYEGTVTGTGTADQLLEAGSNMALIMAFLGISLISLGFYFKKAQIFLTN